MRCRLVVDTHGSLKVGKLYTYEYHENEHYCYHIFDGLQKVATFSRGFFDRCFSRLAEERKEKIQKINESI